MCPWYVFKKEAKTKDLRLVKVNTSIYNIIKRFSSDSTYYM